MTNINNIIESLNFNDPLLDGKDFDTLYNHFNYTGILDVFGCIGFVKKRNSDTWIVSINGIGEDLEEWVIQHDFYQTITGLFNTGQLTESKRLKIKG